MTSEQRRTYYWRVRARDSDGWGATGPRGRSGTGVISTSAGPFESGKWISEVTVPPRRHGSRTRSISYRLQVSRDEGFATCDFDQAGLTDTVEEISSLGYQTKYYWRMNSTDTGAAGAWSPVWTFTTQAAPTIVLPTVPLTFGSVPVTGYSCVTIIPRDRRESHGRDCGESPSGL